MKLYQLVSYLVFGWAAVTITVGHKPAYAGQTPVIMAPEGASVLSDGTRPVADVMIYRQHNRIFVPVSTHTGERLIMLFDSGATTSILLTEPEELTAQDDGVHPIYFPAFDVKAFGKKAEGLRFSIGEAPLPQHTGYRIHAGLKERIERDFYFQGILGQDVLRHYIVEIHMAKRRLRLWPRSAQVAERFQTARAIEEDGGRPVIELSTDLPWNSRKKNQKLLLDTGYPGSLVMWSTKRFKRKLEGVHDSIRDYKNFAMVMDFGFSGARLKRAPIFVVESRLHAKRQDGIVGMAFLSMLHFAIDMNRQRLYLNPIRHTDFTKDQSIRLLAYSPTREPALMLDLRPRVTECMRRSCINMSINQLSNVSRLMGKRSNID